MCLLCTTKQVPHDPLILYPNPLTRVDSFAQQILTVASTTDTMQHGMTTAPRYASSGLWSTISGVLTSPAFRDWFKLLMIGSGIEVYRRLSAKIWTALTDMFWVTASLDDDDSCYDWILFWLSKNSAWTQARSVGVTTRDYNLNCTATISVDGQDDGRILNRQITFIPSNDKTYSLWYRGRYMAVRRTETHNGHWGNKKEALVVSILTRDRTLLSDLLSEARAAYKEAEEYVISVHMVDNSNSWRLVTTRPKRPLKSIILEPGVKEQLLEDARDFLDSQDWYADRGIPFRRGYLLYGAPGSGKTSIIQSIAGELGLDVYILTLSRAGMDDNALSSLISELPKRCIALMEDIDAAFRRGISRDLPGQDGSCGHSAESGRSTPKSTPEDFASRVTLSGLLNALDGIAAQEGRILFATTNDYSALDPALIRPGRMDVHIEFKLASKYQAEELFKCFYVLDIDSATCGDNARHVRSGKVESGYSTRAPSVDSTTDRRHSSSPPPPSGSAEKHTQMVPVFSRSKGVTLRCEEALVLAMEFADAIPDHEVSMASLQGYLMRYKTRPYDAVRDAPAWVLREREERIAKGRR